MSNAQTEPVPLGQRLRTCGRCTAYYTDSEPGKAAHRIVFGHQAQPTTVTEAEPDGQ